MNAIEANLEMIIESLCESGVSHRDAYKLLNYSVGSNLKKRLTMIVGSKVLCKKELDNVGISQENIKLSRYIFSVLNMENDYEK